MQDGDVVEFLMFNLRQNITTIFMELLLGANIIPGVSGGTLAVLNIYDQLISAITLLFSKEPPLI